MNREFFPTTQAQQNKSAVMKRPTTIRFALLVAVALFTYAAFAAKPPPPPPPPLPSSGTLVLNYPGPTGEAQSWGLVAAPSGTIYAVGNSWDGAAVPSGRQLVLASSDSGNSWSLLED